jgi:hypothetical protein
VRWITEGVLRQALDIAAKQHGHVLNRAMFARELRLSIPTVKALLLGMESMGWIRLLPALQPEGAHRCFRKPRMQLTSAPLLARILGPRHGGRTAAAALIEGIINAERRIYPKSRFLHYGGYELMALDLVVVRQGLRAGYLFVDTGERYELVALDLVVVRQGLRAGYLFVDTGEPGLRTTMPLRRAIRSGVVNKGFVLHTGDRCFFCARRVLAVPAQLFLARYEDFTIPHEHPDPWFLLCRWVNGAFTGVVPVHSLVPRSSLGGLDPDLLRLLRRL